MITAREPLMNRAPHSPSAKATMTSGPIVVGVDGSPASRAALRWAAGEAEHRSVGLQVMHVCPIVEAAGLSAPVRTALATECRAHAARLLDAARGELVAGGTRAPVSTARCDGPVVDQLIRLGADAGLLILGRLRTSTTLLGSTVHRVVAYARKPVVVVPTNARAVQRSDTPVVAVGVSRSEGTSPALRAAFEHAQRVGGQVLAVRAWGALDWAGLVSLYTPNSAERWRLASQHLLDDAVDLAAREYPTVPVRTRLVRGPVLDALLTAAAEADLLILAGRPCPDARSSQLGWTATAVLAQSTCPVQVCPARSTDRPVPVGNAPHRCAVQSRRNLALAGAS